jgi:transposase
VADQLDLTPIHAEYGEERCGQPPYDPRMMTKLLMYGYCVGVYSSRKIQLRLQEDVAFRVLAAGNETDFRTISDFRKIHLKTLSGFFEEALKIVQEAGTIELGRVALDGTKIKANASKHKAMSYDRMAQQEEAIREQVKELMAKAAATDAEEDARFGKDKRGDELPEELQRHETRLARIREARRVVEERAREKAKAAGKPEDEAKPEDKAQYIRFFEISYQNARI